MRLNLIHIIWFLYSFFVFNNSVYGQCDVAISSWDAISGDIVIDVINSENCGCNEFTSEATTCAISGSPYVGNNETISHIVLGLHVEGLDYNWGCINSTNHTGWLFKPFALYGNGVLESGDTWSANVYDSPSSSACWAEILANDSLCTEIVVWQINLSQTATTDSGGWAVNPNIAAQTQNYPDVDLLNNTAIYCAPPACDTVYVDVEVIEYLTDTIIEYVDVEWVTIDTLYVTEVDTLIEYVQLPPDTVQVIEYVDIIEYINIIEYIYDTIVLVETDTLVEYQYIYLTDTMYVETVVYEYVYVYETDTITEFLVESVYIDCATGEECIQVFPCDEVSIFAPNAVTPNGDGWNDTWMVIADGACWDQWDVRVYNRWGGLVWISASSMDEWDADVATGTYVYTITAHSSVNASVFEFNGTITVLY
jgi:gliding motility-associated-like protein|tara:strand:- start:5531 stop:6799 length:1269 start_codon:yes stop_codon:yes gene_type:complete